MKTRFILIAFICWAAASTLYAQSHILSITRSKTAFNILVTGSMNKKSIILNVPESRTVNTAVSMFRPVICIDAFNIAEGLERFYSRYYPYSTGINPTSMTAFNLRSNSLKAFLFTSEENSPVFEALKFIDFNTKNNLTPFKPAFFDPWKRDMKKFSFLFPGQPQFTEGIIGSQNWLSIAQDVMGRVFKKNKSSNASLVLRNTLLNKDMVIMRDSDALSSFKGLFSNTNRNTAGVIAFLGYSNHNFRKARAAGKLCPSLLVKKLSLIAGIDIDERLFSSANRNALISKIPEIAQKLKKIPLLVITENPGEEHFIKQQLSLYKKRGLNITVGAPGNIYKF
jgi:hypothetical protein